MDVPIIDLSLLHRDSHQRSLVIQDIRQACQSVGIFHAINHGVPERVIDEVVQVNAEFFDMPREMKEEFISSDISKPVRYSTVEGGAQRTIARDFLKLYAHPLEDFVDLWPKSPPDYRVVLECTKKMAITNGTGDTSGPKLHLETMRTVMPMNPTDPRLSLPVLAAGNLDSGIYKRCFNIVLCYNKASDEDSASLVAAWIKQTLGKALSEQPMLAGRLRRKDGVEEKELEIVSNDSGVRLIEAKFALTLQDFLDLEEKNEAESQLAFWEDIDFEQNPQFSPLFYVQVSNFKCGGYAIGISCSLLLIDPFAMISFLKRWTRIHLEMISKGDDELPIFFRPKLGPNRYSLGLPTNSSTKAGAAQSMIFNIASKVLKLEKEIHKNIAAQCIDESEQKLQLKAAANVSMVIKEPSEGVIKVQNFARNELIQKPSTTVINGITCSSNWDHLETDQICFREGNKPAYVSFWINSVLDEAFVMVFPSQENDSEGLKIIVTLPI